MGNNNYFGNYLSELRRSRGYSNTNEYLRKYPIPMSNVHYRHLESGNRKIGTESARELCEALEADAKVFYCNLLKDSLPSEFMDFFVSLSTGDTGISSSSDQEAVKQQYQSAVMHALESQVLFPTEAACQYLDVHFELLPLLWFIYSVKEANLKNIEALLLKNAIRASAVEIVNKFVQLGLVQTEMHKELVVTRMKSSICFSHHDLGLKILRHETERALSEYVEPRNPELKDSVLILSVMSASKETRKIIFRRIQDIVSQLRQAAQVSFDDASEDSQPVFYSIVFAPRKQYAVKPVSE